MFKTNPQRKADFRIDEDKIKKYFLKAWDPSWVGIQVSDLT